MTTREKKNPETEKREKIEIGEKKTTRTSEKMEIGVRTEKKNHQNPSRTSPSRASQASA